jgi:hypothetical protein
LCAREVQLGSRGMVERHALIEGRSILWKL